jgi:hypothetical protein
VERKIFPGEIKQMRNPDDKHEKYKIALDEARHAADLLWKIFNAFMVAQTIFLSFILDNIFSNPHNPKYIPEVFYPSILGLLWYGTFQRSHAYYIFRIAQAIDNEPNGWNIIGGAGKRFAEGEEYVSTSTKKPIRIPKLGQALRLKISVPLLIGLFAFTYLVIIFFSGPWWIWICWILPC